VMLSRLINTCMIIIELTALMSYIPALKSQNMQTRGHDLKLQKFGCHTRLRSNFSSMWVVMMWNRSVARNLLLHDGANLSPGGQASGTAEPGALAVYGRGGRVQGGGHPLRARGFGGITPEKNGKAKRRCILSLRNKFLRS
jgi:hypothetical protein